MWKIRRDPFWTFPHDFSEMATAAPELYEELSASKLVIFKGDLNYRKLVGDLEWPVQTSFSKALRGFRPAPLVALRTLVRTFARVWSHWMSVFETLKENMSSATKILF